MEGTLQAGEVTAVRHLETGQQRNFPSQDLSPEEKGAEGKEAANRLLDPPFFKGLVRLDGICAIKTSFYAAEVLDAFSEWG